MCNLITSYMKATRSNYNSQNNIINDISVEYKYKCCCNNKKKTLRKMSYRETLYSESTRLLVKRKNKEACKFSINFNFNGKFFTFNKTSNFEHNHNPTYEKIQVNT